MNYTLREVRAYLGAIDRLERARMAASLTVANVAAQGLGKDVEKLRARLLRP